MTLRLKRGAPRAANRRRIRPERPPPNSGAAGRGPRIREIRFVDSRRQVLDIIGPSPALAPKSIVSAQDDYLIDTLLELGYVAPEQVDQARADASATGEGVVDLLVTRGAIPAKAVAQAKATHFGVEMVDLAGVQLEDEVIAAAAIHNVRSLAA